jgi:hypothetical protein
VLGVHVALNGGLKPRNLKKHANKLPEHLVVTKRCRTFAAAKTSFLLAVSKKNHPFVANQ